MKPVYITGLKNASDTGRISSAIRDIVLKATENLSWLSSGETVLLKPALNSADPYPSTTHPLAVSVTASLLAERGAVVVIGDQSGIEHVLHHPGGVVRGSTREHFTRSGMGAFTSSRFVGFEEGGWDEGFYHHRSLFTPSWQDGFHITAWAKKADHVISLPRVSTHSMAGASLGFKNMVGMLREDSRMEFHANGPMNGFIMRSAKGSTLASPDDKSGKFFEKIVEISDAVRDKLRLTLFLATEVQSTFGPDRYGIPLGRTGLGRAYVVRPEPGLVFCSADPVAAEAAGLAVLQDAKQSLPHGQRVLERAALFRNRHVKDLESMNIRDHPYIRHSLEIGLGEMPQDLVYEEVPAGVRNRLSDLVYQAG